MAADERTEGEVKLDFMLEVAGLVITAVEVAFGLFTWIDPEIHGFGVRFKTKSLTRIWR